MDSRRMRYSRRRIKLNLLLFGYEKHNKHLIALSTHYCESNDNH